MLLRVQFIIIMKVIMTYDYLICRTSLALSLCKKYQIVCATEQLFVYMHEKHIYPHARVNLYEMSTYIQVMLKVIGFSILNMPGLV